MPPHSRKACAPRANKDTAFLPPAHPEGLRLTEFKAANEKKWLAPTCENSVVASPSAHICFFYEKTLSRGITSWESPSFFEMLCWNAAKQGRLRDQVLHPWPCVQMSLKYTVMICDLPFSPSFSFQRIFPFHHKNHYMCLADKIFNKANVLWVAYNKPLRAVNCILEM